MNEKSTDVRGIKSTWVLGFPKKSANLVLPFGQLYINIYVDIFINTLAGLPDVAQVYIIIHNWCYSRHLHSLGI